MQTFLHIGLIPVAGDVITLAIAMRLIHTAQKADIPKSLTNQMFFNVALDFGVSFFYLETSLLFSYLRVLTFSFRLLRNSLSPSPLPSICLLLDCIENNTRMLDFIGIRTYANTCLFTLLFSLF